MSRNQYGSRPAKLFFSGLIACGLMIGNADLAAAASTKKDVRKTMSEKRKAELRKWGREWCIKNYIRGSTHILRVEILSDGRVRCWYKG
jgi:hypothetical protein